MCSEIISFFIVYQQWNNLIEPIVTNHIEYLSHIRTNGIKPLISLEVNILYKSSQKNIEGNLVFIAKNELGYKNLLKIHDYAYLYKDDWEGIL